MSNAVRKPKSMPKDKKGMMTAAELIRFVRKHSPFYKQLYKDLPDTAQLKDLPLTPLDEYWAANTLKNNKVLTGPITDGMVIRSGGTTGSPKFSVFSKEEFHFVIEYNAESFDKGIFTENDRVANLFFSGGLYGSFIGTTLFMENASVGILQLPLTGNADFADSVKIIRDFQANVLIGGPTTLMRIAEYIQQNVADFNFNQITKVLFAGESFYLEQRKKLKAIFPNVEIYSIGYGSNDGGIMGYADLTCDIAEHRCFDGHQILEIIDEKTQMPIEDVGVPGILVLTNLSRRLMPTVRYPIGDRGQWVEPKGTPDRKFLLLDRSEEGAKIGRFTFFTHDVKNLLASFWKNLKIEDFQILIFHKNNRNGVKIKIASRLNPEELKKHSQNIVDTIVRAYPDYESMVSKMETFPLEIDWCERKDLEVSPRTGKHLRVIDQRLK